MRIVCGNSWAPPAAQEEDSAAPSTSVLPVAWREICKEPVKVKVFQHVLMWLVWVLIAVEVQLDP